MTTPTKEQIEAEFASFIEYPSEDKRYVTTASCLLFAEHIARIAHTAGRDQGLREAKHANGNRKYTHADECAAAIDHASITHKEPR